MHLITLPTHSRCSRLPQNRVAFVSCSLALLLGRNDSLRRNCVFPVVERSSLLLRAPTRCRAVFLCIVLRENANLRDMRTLVGLLSSVRWLVSVNVSLVRSSCCVLPRLFPVLLKFLFVDPRKVQDHMVWLHAADPDDVLKHFRERRGCERLRSRHSCVSCVRFPSESPPTRAFTRRIYRLDSFISHRYHR